MEDAEKYLAPFEEHVTLTRNGTELSRFCERLVVAFLGYGASCARVRCEMAPFPADRLYEGLRNVCGKNGYRGSVARPTGRTGGWSS